jgi:hypothetical protein
MPHGAVITATLVLVLFAGCVAPASVPGRPTPGGTSFEALAGDGGAGRSLSTPPRWASGEWFRIEAMDAFSHNTTNVTIVVAGAIGDDYLLGMPLSEVSLLDGIVPLHIPPFGEVSRRNLSYMVHGHRFLLAPFPLRDGDAWPTSFEGVPINASAQAVNDSVAVIRTDGPYPIVATYDAHLGWFSSIEVANYGSFRVTAHGFGFAGPLYVPSHLIPAWLVGRAAGAFGLNVRPALPTESATLPPGLDRASVGVLVGDLLPASQRAGVYRETDTAPDGQTWTFSSTPGKGIQLFIYGKDQPSGTWSFTHIAGGPGFVASEGVAYRAFELVLPGTALRPAPVVPRSG